MYLKNRIEGAYIDKSGQDADGYEKNTERRLPLWAHAESSKSSEFYEAAQAGMKVERVYVVRSRSFDRRSKFVYDGETKLQITRVYDRLDGLTELHCSDMKVD